jgi:hypothetical protein
MAREPWYTDLGFHVLCIASMVGTPIVLQVSFGLTPLYAWVFGPLIGGLVTFPVSIVTLGVPFYTGRVAFRWLLRFSR